MNDAARIHRAAATMMRTTVRAIGQLLKDRSRCNTVPVIVDLVPLGVRETGALRAV